MRYASVKEEKSKTLTLFNSFTVCFYCKRTKCLLRLRFLLVPLVFSYLDKTTRIERVEMLSRRDIHPGVSIILEQSRDEDIEKNLFEKRSDAEQFQKELCQKTVAELNKHIEKIQKTRDMFVDRLAQFEIVNYGPLFQNYNDDNNDNITKEAK